MGMYDIEDLRADAIYQRQLDAGAEADAWVEMRTETLCELLRANDVLVDPRAECELIAQQELNVIRQRKTGALR